jgi:hypothetical protein
VSFLFSFYLILVALLLLLLGWALRTPRKRGEISVGPATLEETGQCHVTYLPQIRQALAPADFDFLASRASAKLTRRVRKERRRIALVYLSAVQEDFHRLLRLARVIAVLSPEVSTAQESERLRLGVQFTLRCQMIRAELLLGLAPLPQLSGLSQMVSGLAVRMETAITELGERAALATELTSSLERRGIGLN